MKAPVQNKLRAQSAIHHSVSDPETTVGDDLLLKRLRAVFTKERSEVYPGFDRPVARLKSVGSVRSC